MPRRPIPADPSIGDRIRARRQLRGWSVRHAASRAGISHTSWSRIEHGKQRTDRYLVVDLAAALECSVTDLTGQPYATADRQLEAARFDGERVWRTMLNHPLTEPTAGPMPPIEQLTRESELVRDLYARCDYAGALQRLVHLIPALHKGKDSRDALMAMVPVYGVAMGSLLNVGYPAQAWLAVDHCVAAAEQLDDPVALAVAAANRARLLAYSGAYGPARAVCDRTADELQTELATPTALDALGFLHLARAHHMVGLHDFAGADDHLAEANRIAERTGETGHPDHPGPGDFGQLHQQRAHTPGGRLHQHPLAGAHGRRGHQHRRGTTIGEHRDGVVQRQPGRHLEEPLDGHADPLRVPTGSAGGGDHPPADHGRIHAGPYGGDGTADPVAGDHRQVTGERSEAGRPELGLHEGDVGEHHRHHHLPGPGYRVRGVTRDEHLRPAERRQPHRAHLFPRSSTQIWSQPATSTEVEVNPAR
jgi:transcriptional regulator with XRE-family HTH domain